MTHIFLRRWLVSSHHPRSEKIDQFSLQLPQCVGRGLDYVAKEAIVGCVKPIINRVRASTPASIDFDELLGDIVKAQRLVSAICTKMQSGIVLQILGLMGSGFACIITLNRHWATPSQPGFLVD